MEQPAKKNALVIISLGGSLVYPEGGPNPQFLRRFRALVLERVARGERFVLVMGGGTPCRIYQHALRTLGVRDGAALDWMGIAVTHANATFVRLMFGVKAYPTLVTRPATLAPSVFRRYPIVCAGGEKPGQTTDDVATQCAVRLGAETVVNMSNVDAIYDKDPRRHKGARRFERLTWGEFKNIFPEAHTPGAHIPFDPRATTRATRARLPVAFIGSDLANLERFLAKRKFRGTLVTPL